MKNRKNAISTNRDITNNDIQRIPRPIGTTEIGRNLHQTYNHNNDPNPKQTIKDNLLPHIINHYINNNYRYNNIPYTTTQFAIHINTSEDIILQYIYNNIGKQYNELSEEQQSHIFGVLNQSMIRGFLKSQQAVQHHTQLLLESQGASYKPFISSEVTKALKLSLDAINVGTQLHNRFFPNDKGSPTIMINNNQNQNTFSINEAQMLINQNKEVSPLLENEKAKEGLYIEYSLNDMPEVNANMQVGIDNSKEGLNFANMNLELLEDAHTDRRAKELDIDLDSDNI